MFQAQEFRWDRWWAVSKFLGNFSRSLLVFLSWNIPLSYSSTICLYICQVREQNVFRLRIVPLCLFYHTMILDVSSWSMNQCCWGQRSSDIVQVPRAEWLKRYIFVLFKRIFVFRSEGIRQMRIVVIDSVIFARPWILKIIFPWKNFPFVVGKSISTFSGSIQHEGTFRIICSRGRDPFPVDNISFIPKSKSGSPRLKSSFLDIVEWSLTSW